MPPKTARRPPASKPEAAKYVVVKDSREKEGHGWTFRASKNCGGMVRAALKTGDYTLVGLEEVACVERKESVSEVANNLASADLARFERELARMSTFKVSAVVFEFTLEELLQWPADSGIPYAKRRFIRTTGAYLLKKICELQAEYPHVRFWFAGEHGQTAALAILKQAWADHGS